MKLYGFSSHIKLWLVFFSRQFISYENSMVKYYYLNIYKYVSDEYFPLIQLILKLYWISSHINWE